MTNTINSFTAVAAASAAASAQEEYERRLIEAGISNAKQIGVTLLSPQEVSDEIGFTKGTGAIRIQYPDFEGNLTSFARYRFLGIFNGNKYHQIPGTGTRAYAACNKGIFLQRLADITEPLIITEGEFKAIRCAADGYLTIGLGGVDSITKQFEGDKRLIEPLSLIPIGKQVYIAYDYDAVDATEPGEPKPEVHNAELRLAAMLMLRGCNVFFVRIGDRVGNNKVGLDDFLNNGGSLAERMAIAKLFKPSKSDGVHYLLSNYAVMEGDVLHVKTNTMLATSKFVAQEKNCQNPFGDKGDEKVPPTTRYLMSLDRTSLSGVAFNPGLNCMITPDNELNIWRGFKTHPKKGDVSLWLSFLDLFFSADPDIRHHFEATMALTLQKPWVKQDRLCILKSGMTGIGKSFYFETIAAIINGSPKGRPNGKFDHAIVTSARDLDSDFNSSLAGKKFVVFNEIGEKGEKHTNLLKDLVTGHSLTINEKYSRARSVANYLQFNITTNERFTHIMDADSRRELVYSIAKTSLLAKKLREFFSTNTALKTWVNTDEARAALLYYYLQYDLQGYDGTQPAPINESKEEIASEIFNDIDYYIHEELADVPYIMPKLECQKIYARFTKLNYSESYIRSRLREAGYTKGAFDKTKSQLNLGEKLSKGNKEMMRPVVLCLEGVAQSATDSKEYIAELLHERYFGTRKL